MLRNWVFAEKDIYFQINDQAACVASKPDYLSSVSILQDLETFPAPLPAI